MVVLLKNLIIIIKKIKQKLARYQEQEIYSLKQELNKYKFKLKYTQQALAQEKIENENNKITLNAVLTK